MTECTTFMSWEEQCKKDIRDQQAKGENNMKVTLQDNQFQKMNT